MPAQPQSDPSDWSSRIRRGALVVRVGVLVAVSLPVLTAAVLLATLSGAPSPWLLVGLPWLICTAAAALPLAFGSGHAHPADARGVMVAGSVIRPSVSLAAGLLVGWWRPDLIGAGLPAALVVFYLVNLATATWLSVGPVSRCSAAAAAGPGISTTPRRGS